MDMVSRTDALRIAVLADVDPRTVARELERWRDGARARNRAGERVRHALERVLPDLARALTDGSVSAEGSAA